VNPGPEGKVAVRLSLSPSFDIPVTTVFVSEMRPYDWSAASTHAPLPVCMLSETVGESNPSCDSTTGTAHPCFTPIGICKLI
jgi:hypothetical protein